MAKKLRPDTKRRHAKVWTECFTCPFPDCIKLDCRHYLKGEPRMTNDGYFPASMYQEPLLLVDEYTLEWDRKYLGMDRRYLEWKRRDSRERRKRK